MMYSRNMISHLKCISFYSFHHHIVMENSSSNLSKSCSEAPAIDTISRYLFERPYIIIANYYHKIGHP